MEVPPLLRLLILLYLFNLTGSPFLAVVDARQQCRLQAPQDQAEFASPNDPFPSPGSNGTNNGTSSNGTTTNPAITPFAYGTDKIRGVNLGGWFVLEPWITPSIFENTGNDDIIDEFTFGQHLNSSYAQQVLQQHWNTWITEDDFKAIRAAGLNHVRIPLGYWSVPMDDNESVSPYIAGAWPYFLRALNWAKSNSLNVIVDLHGAPGSQNGYDNSGQRTNNPVWATGDGNVNRTIEILSFIAEKAGGMIDVLELLNEAAGFISSEWATTIRQFWQDGYNAVRQAAGSGMKIMIGDAFLTVQNWENFLTYPSSQGVMMDIHEYQIFSVEELQRSNDEHIDFACSLIPGLADYDQNDLWTIVGEWSTASTDCAQWLNGRGIGSRWDGTYPGSGTPTLGSCAGLTGNSANFSSDFKSYLRKYWEVQVDIGESVSGWIYWTWKTESADEWSYQKGLEGGWIPQDPTERLYPGLCNNTSG
ncbi:glycoside hydrolase family 5 protein [Fomitiporia mediterranea MF3/22]|uniref:glycoside hydrolase family 5 protein n=1 Tax=Fomitiporia mediterranea (strain MF3/22) TaxID=694068 RepID=UPI0004407625|nr:glycoside hydrolase family 5 protein [Fomitiporia mediterranea MF3/22]EJD06576.1 glycoside hydrolase family 5 protein [Fomitiporia mediterranea MF3/22]